MAAKRKGSKGRVLRKGEGQRRFQICPPKTIKGIRKIPLASKALLKTFEPYKTVSFFA